MQIFLETIVRNFGREVGFFFLNYDAKVANYEKFRKISELLSEVSTLFSSTYLPYFWSFSKTFKNFQETLCKNWFLNNFLRMIENDVKLLALFFKKFGNIFGLSSEVCLFFSYFSQSFENFQESLKFFSKNFKNFTKFWWKN